METQHLVKFEVHVEANSPYKAAKAVLEKIRREGIKDSTTKLKTGYIVKWAIDMFGSKSMEQAAVKSLEWLKEPRGETLCHIFFVQNKKTKECFKCDLDYPTPSKSIIEAEFNKL